MIIEMARVRVLGPRERLGDTIRALQERGVLHLVDAQPVAGMRSAPTESTRKYRSYNGAAADTALASAGG